MTASQHTGGPGSRAAMSGRRSHAAIMHRVCARSTGVAAVCLAAFAASGCHDQVGDPARIAAPSLQSRAQSEGAPVSLQWQQTARDLVVKYRTDPLVTYRLYALVSMARYAGITDATAGGGRRELEVERGAAAGASAAVLADMYPAEKASLDDMVRAQEAIGPGGPHPHFARGEADGRAAAQRVLARATTDGFDAPWPGGVPVGVGLWVSTGMPPARPMLASMRPFFLASGAQFRPGPPPAYGSPAFVAALTEVSAISAGPRTAEQLALAQFWALRVGTVTTQGYWGERAAELIRAAGLGETGASHVLALLDAAAMDAAIGCWDAKYTYWLLRPSHATAAFGLPPISLPIGLPTHPSYPSGHSCVSGASSEVLGQLFPADAERLGRLAVEMGRSRVYAGIHYQFDADVGLALGRDIGRFAVEYDRARGVLAALR